MTAAHCADSSAVQPACQLSIVQNTITPLVRMQTSSGSAERPADNADDSSACSVDQLPASWRQLEPSALFVTS